MPERQDAIVGAKKKRNLPNFRELGLVLFIVIIMIIVQLLNNNFFTIGNLKDMINNAAILGILSVGMLMVMLTGGIDLSIGSNMALTGMVAALMISNNPDIHPIFAILLGMIMGAVCGLLIGLLVSQLNVLPIIASLGMNYVYRGLTTIISGGSWVSAHQLPESFKKLGTGTFGIGPFQISYLIWAAIIVFIVAAYFLQNTRTGRKIYAVGSNKDAVSISGINPRSTQTLTYTVMGLLAGLGGVLWVAKFASAQPDTATGYEVNAIAACVMGGVSVTGGRGNWIGVLLGTLLIGIINNVLPLLSVYISPFWQDLIKGCIILGAILLNIVTKRRRDAKDLKRREI